MGRSQVGQGPIGLIHHQKVNVGVKVTVASSKGVLKFRARVKLEGIQQSSKVLSRSLGCNYCSARQLGAPGQKLGATELFPKGNAPPPVWQLTLSHTLHEISTLATHLPISLQTR